MRLAARIIFIIFCFCAVAVADSKTGIISGRVMEESTMTPVEKCLLVVIGTSLQAYSNTQGYYVIEDIPVGTHSIIATRDGYRAQSVTDLEVKNGLRTTVNLRLKPEATQSFSLESSADYFTKPDDTATSYQHLSVEEIRRIPGTAEDVNMALQSLPGVAPTDDRGANIVVRGGMPGENLSLVDGFDSGATNHFSSDFGADTDLFCTINSKIINDVEFYAGAFPARFGDRLSSVTAINLKSPATDRIHAEGDVNLAGASSSLQVPIVPGFAMLAAGRYSFIEILNQFVNVAGETVPHFYDWQGKGLAQLSENQQLEILTLGATDGLDINPGVEGNGNGYHYHFTNDFIGLGHDIGWSGGITSTKISYGRQRWTANYDEFDNRSTLQTLTLHVDERIPINDTLSGNLGAEGRLHNLDMNFITGPHYTQEGYLIPYHQSLLGGDANQEAGYAALEFRPHRWQISAGTRYDRLSLIHSAEVNPRLGAAFQFVPRWTVSASAGRYTQFPNLGELVQYGDPAVLAESAYHFVGGMEYEPAPAWQFSVEAFYYQLARLITTGAVGYDWVIQNSARGYSRGVELGIRRQFADSYFLMLSYTLQRARMAEEGSGWYPRDYDQPQILNLQGGYKPTRNWYFGAKWRFAAGRPYTPVIGRIFNPAANRYFAIYGATNSVRYPNYNRMDVRLERKDYPGGLTLVSYIECWNILDRRNVIAYDWNNDFSGKDTIYSIMFVPAIGFSLEF